MKKKLSVLIIEDHPVVVTAYRMAIERMELVGLEFEISMAKDCDSANSKIIGGEEGSGFDIIVLDMNLPSSKDGKIRTGEDLALKIRKELPNAKIIVCTSYYDNLKIQSIMKAFDPEGFLVKNDFELDELKICIEAVLSGRPYYSLTVLNSLRKLASVGHKIDEIDRLLLYELSIGTRMNELPRVVPLSMTSIERRKRQLKGMFRLNISSDRELVIEAKNRGFI